MANEVSNRRDKTNRFYVTIISLLITIFSLIGSLTKEFIIIIFPFIAMIIISYVWMKNIESYSTLNRAKFDVINKIEEELYAKGFSVEWALLKSYNYQELSKVEKFVPKLSMIVATIIMFIIIVLCLIQKGYCIG